METLKGCVVLLFLLGFGLMLTGCHGAFFGTCPDLDESDSVKIYLEHGDYEVVSRVSDEAYRGRPPTVYMRVVSDSVVELAFERDGEVVVETFAVVERERRTQY